MTHTVDAVFVFQALSAVLYVLLGAWVLTLDTRRRQTILLGVFALLYGSTFLILDAFQLLDIQQETGGLAFILQTPGMILAWSAAFGLAAYVGGRVDDGRLPAIAATVGLGVAVLRGATGFAYVPDADWPLVPVALVLGLTMAAVVLLALRVHPSRTGGRGRAVQFALLAVAFALFRAFQAGEDLLDAAAHVAGGALGEAAASLAVVLPWIVAAAFWGHNMLRADDETVAAHRAAMLGILGLVLVGALAVVTIPSAGGAREMATRGVTRTLGVGLLAYGVLRHDLAGLDAKVEWGVSKTTVAGIFVAVFFIAGELAETFFGDVFGDYVGVIAAGMLVFALSPLQQVADRFAERAVPGGNGASSAERRYRTAVRVALSDGRISADEERSLAELQAELGLDPVTAVEIERELRDEEQGGPG